jgi:hypothetical protein
MSNENPPEGPNESGVHKFATPEEIESTVVATAKLSVALGACDTEALRNARGIVN